MACLASSLGPHPFLILAAMSRCAKIFESCPSSDEVFIALGFLLGVVQKRKEYSFAVPCFLEMYQSSAMPRDSVHNTQAHAGFNRPQRAKSRRHDLELRRLVSLL